MQRDKLRLSIVPCGLRSPQLLSKQIKLSGLRCFVPSEIRFHVQGDKRRGRSIAQYANEGHCFQGLFAEVGGEEQSTEGVIGFVPSNVRTNCNHRTGGLSENAFRSRSQEKSVQSCNSVGSNHDDWRGV